MRRRPGRTLLPALAALIPLVFLAVFFLLPVAAMIARGLHPDGRWTLGPALEVLSRPRTGRVLWFTLWISTLGTAITVLLGVPIAYVTYRLALPFTGLVRGLLVMPFVLPTVVVGIAFRSLLAPSGPLGFLGWDGSWQAILAAVLIATGYKLCKPKLFTERYKQGWSQFIPFIVTILAILRTDEDLQELPMPGLENLEDLLRSTAVDAFVVAIRT